MRDSVQARRHFLILRALRWVPSGLLVPVLVILLLQRGLSLGEVGLVMATQGLVVLLLELPTGGLADALGRRPVLLIGTAVEALATSLLIVADTLPLLIAVFALQGIYRALESGPLDAWYVDAAQSADPDADIEAGLSAGGIAFGVAMALGTLTSGALVAIAPFPTIDPLVLPLIVAVGLRGVELIALWLLMEEVRPHAGTAAVAAAVREIPAVIGHASRLITGRRVLVALLAIELLWGLGMTSFETFTPARLEAVLGQPDQAAALLGPTNAVAWLIAAAGAAAVPTLLRRLGPAPAGAWLRMAQGATVVAIALTGGPAGVIAAYLLTLGVHGAANPIHQGILHRAVHGPSHRATVVSANNLTAQLGAALGGIGLGALADATTLSTAIVTGAGLLAIAAPLYIIAGRDMSATPHDDTVAAAER